MMKKILFILLLASFFSLASCGSTKGQQDIDPDAISELTEPQAPEVEEDAEEADAQEGADADAQADAQAESATDETLDSNQSEKTEEDSLEDYPPLEEIPEPEVIDIPAEELEKIEKQKQEKEEAEKQKLEEPVTEEEEELPPLPEGTVQNEEQTAEDSQDGQAVQAEEDPLAVVNVEPQIEIQEEEQPVIEKEIIPSRSVTLKKGETLIITYPGSGWIYMGSTSEYNNLASRGRKLGTTDTKYTLFAKEAGTQIHHFYKTDNLTGNYIDDYIEVTVVEKKGNSKTVVNAPDYKEVVPSKPATPAKSSATKKKEAQAQAQEQAQEQPKSQTQAQAQKPAQTKKETPAAKPAPSKNKDEDVIVVDDIQTGDEVIAVEESNTPKELAGYITKAKTLIDSKDYSGAYSTLTTYLEYADDNRDEALYLLGQILEADSPIKNIKEAINTYQTLCDSYPTSRYWDDANKRIIYLKRFYINIH
ncbi:MAG: outer membrane protein assembly factor BamD [Treponema sp.]|nr:outer membrane protein assembly factor BamD [Treponema sp.]